MAKIVNLKQARKQRDRLEKSAQATENAIKFGRSRAKKNAEEAAGDKLRKHLDQHEITSPRTLTKPDPESP